MGGTSRFMGIQWGYNGILMGFAPENIFLESLSRWFLAFSQWKIHYIENRDGRKPINNGMFATY